MASNNPYDFGDPIGNFYQGYQQAYIPQQMKQQQQAAAAQQQMNAMKQAMMQQEMQYAPQMNTAKMQQMQLQNQGLGIGNQLDAQKLKMAQADADRRRAFMTMLQGGSSGSSSSQPSSPYAPSAPTAGSPASSMMGGPNQAPNNSVMPPINQGARYGQSSPNPMIMNGGMQPGQQPAQAVNPQLPSQGMGTSQQAPNSQPSQMDRIDQMYLDPTTRGQFGDIWKQQFPNVGEQIFNDPTTGQLVIATKLPSGRVDVKTQQAGPTAEQTAFSKERGKGDAALYNSALAQNQQLSKSSVAIDGILNQLNDPIMKEIIGPTKQSLVTQFFGTPEQKDKLGEFKSNAGTAYTDLMQSLKGTGSISDKEGDSFKEIKPNTNDSPEIVVGKVRASKIVSTFANQRNSAFLNNMDKGMSSRAALELAEKQVPLSKVKDDINNIMAQANDMVKGFVWIQFPDGKIKSVKAQESSKWTDPSIGGRIYGQ